MPDRQERVPVNEGVLVALIALSPIGTRPKEFPSTREFPQI